MLGRDSLWLDEKLDRSEVEWLLLNEKELGKTYLSLKDAKGLVLRAANLIGADLSDLPLANCDLGSAQLDGANLTNTRLENANLERAHLTGARLEGADLRGAWLAMADLREAWLDHRTLLTGAHLFEEAVDASLVREYVRAVCLRGVRWNDTDISNIADLDEFRRLGDDLIPWQLRLRSKLRRGHAPERESWWQTEINDTKYQNYLSNAIAAYRQFATVLRKSGLAHIASRAEYRARQLEPRVHRPFTIRRSSQAWRRRREIADERIERRAQGEPLPIKSLVQLGWFDLVYWLKRALYGGRYYCTRGASFLLDLICGYGYKPLRILAAYVLIILIFARLYVIYPPRPHAPHGWNAIWFSMIAFHGRGVISGDIDPDSGMLWVPALEAVIGLGVEALLVAIIIRHLFRN